MGIGAPLSQIIDIYFPHEIDNYCKIIKQVKYYDAYADDRCIIHHSKQFLRQLLDEIEKIANKLGIHIHKNKTQIVKLNHGFTFLQIRYLILDGGKIIKKISKKSLKSQRQKMNKLIYILTPQEFLDWYKSWRGDKIRYNSYNTLYNLDRRVYKLWKSM